MKTQLIDRFFRYAKLDTQSAEGVTDRYPSTEKQKDLGRLLVEELKAMGLTDAKMDPYGYVMATLPSNLTEAQLNKVPVIGLIAHVDTSPEISGANVQPVLHPHYNGSDIILPADPTQILRAADNPALQDHIGDDIITSDGTTLLGADDKAGIAEIMTALQYLVSHPEIKHGALRIAFTPDEEVGAGTKYFDVAEFGADFAYTIDGENMGEIEDESFNAMLAVFTVNGINVHPGYAKGKLVNAVRIMADLIAQLKTDPAPETTEKREGYLHPYAIEGGVEKCTLKVLIRDFTDQGMETKSMRLHQIRDSIAALYPRAVIELEIKEQYKNMKVKLDENPRVVEFALRAVEQAGMKPRRQQIRGGTDGSRLCFMGLLTPNIFTGGHNFHGRLEWIAVQAMEKATRTIIELVKIWTADSLKTV